MAFYYKEKSDECSAWINNNQDLYEKEYTEKENKYKTVYQHDRPLCFDYQMIHERFDICLDSIVGDQPVEKETNAEEEALPF